MPKDRSAANTRDISPRLGNAPDTGNLPDPNHPMVQWYVKLFRMADELRADDPQLTSGGKINP